jgi:hypothetical protein
MNVSHVLAKDYENDNAFRPMKTKPKQTQFKAKTNPICGMPKIIVTSVLTKDYENVHLHRGCKNKPK